jgi:hypothetical protein
MENVYPKKLHTWHLEKNRGTPLVAKTHIGESICNDFFISCCTISTAGAAIFLIRLSHHASQIINSRIFTVSGSQGIIAGTATGYGLDDPGVAVRVLVGSRIFSSPCLTYRLRGALILAPSLLSNGYRKFFPWG